MKPRETELDRAGWEGAHRRRRRVGGCCAAILLVAPALRALPDSTGVQPSAERPGAPGTRIDDERRLADPVMADSAHDDCEHLASAMDGGPSAAPNAVAEPHAGFALEFEGQVSPHAITSIFVMPGHEATLQAVLLNGDERFVAAADSGALRQMGPAAWGYRAPARPGVYALDICDLESRRTMTVRVFVLEPYAGEDVLSGYRIGRYERLPLHDDPAYAMPRGLVRVTRANEDTWVSPHFQLRQFVCKQEAGYPRFVVLRTQLLTKLEMLVEALGERGVATRGLYVMSGYRTPWYNRAIGNTTRYSRHAYGDAADVFVDDDGNGWMDDLTGDGRATLADARVIAGAIEEMSDDAWYASFAGGLGLYDRNAHRGPFVHVDARGHRARW